MQKLNVIHFEEIDSTSSYLKREVDNLSNLTIAETDYQSAGKGRENRKWYSPKGENAMFSILIKDIDIINRFPLLSLLSCLVVRDYIESLGVDNVEVKWPNDVYINGHKVCGILLEGRIPDYVIIGIGINLNQKEFNDEYRIVPTSVSNELGRNIEKQAFLEGLWNNMLNSIISFKSNQYDVINEFNKYNYLEGREVNFVIDGKTLSGRAIRVNENGYLIVESEGSQYEIMSGEINY